MSAALVAGGILVSLFDGCGTKFPDPSLATRCPDEKE